MLTHASNFRRQLQPGLCTGHFVLDPVSCLIFSFLYLWSFQFGCYLCLGYVFILMLLGVKFFLPSYVPHA